ncbi:integrating conjugative element protein [Corticibacter populi]|uniref:Integrating conjugative element protein n=1 Tax=Corticibacter populi TaxID=1550736 RepID=A0A3M6QV83_9BURK|nr:integrating conjugative element protein [Corticibacter populi]RZS31623.1 integrating conjugative element protein (TIGR03765 family) [Corticibacter populi]
MTRRCFRFPLYGLVSLLAMPAALAQSPPLIVVDDHGGASALPYYEALDLQPRRDQAPPRIEVPRAPSGRSAEAAMLPVRSPTLSPGDVSRRVIQAPGLKPLFLIGDDDRSRAWLQQRAAILRDLGAVGIVVNVESAAALDALRRAAAGLTLVPAPGDDLARRLDLRHYPVLVTSTGIEQ